MSFLLKPKSLKVLKKSEAIRPGTFKLRGPLPDLELFFPLTISSNWTSRDPGDGGVGGGTHTVSCVVILEQNLKVNTLSGEWE